MTAERTACTVTRTYFRTEAKPLVVTVTDGDGKVLYKGVMNPSTTSSGSMGWGLSEGAKMDMTPSTEVKVQAGFNLTIANSKLVPHDDTSKAEMDAKLAKRTAAA